MSILKYETNIKYDFYLKKTKASSSKYKENVEFNVLKVFMSEKKDNIFYGFGGAVTEAAGVAYSKLTDEVKKFFIDSYFSKDNGANYNICRLQIGSSDFSLNSYSYASKKDLSDFSIARDYQYIIPLIKDIQKVNPEVKFVASPWSPPKFMKSNKLLILGGKLLKKYYALYAEYLCKYLLAYREEGINIDFITTQNEPQAIQIWESCIFDMKQEVDFVENYLVPEINKNGLNTRVLLYDHNKEKLFSKAKESSQYLKNPEVISGYAYHFYTGDHFEQLEMVKNEYPGKLLIHTEGCMEYNNTNNRSCVEHGEKYAHDIIGDLKSGCNAYIDWNLILDYNGGPNHKLNFCESPIMLGKESKDFFKNVSLFYISHFSRVIHPGAYILYSSSYTDKIEMVAFKNLDNSIGIVLLNRDNTNHIYNLCIDNRVIHDNLDSHAIVSYVID